MDKQANRVFKGVCTALALMIISSTLQAADLEMKFKVRRGTGDDPMIVAWLEDDEGSFVKTLQMFSPQKKYYKDLRGWKFKSKNSKVDGVTGATIKWGKSSTIKVPVEADGINLLEGKYIIRIESRKDKGKHYRKFEIPLTKGYTGGVHKDAGYVEQVTVTVK